MKRIISAFFSIFFLFCVWMPVSAEYRPNFEIDSQAAYFINTDSGTVLYEKNLYRLMAPASLTKIMTAILVLESEEDLEKRVTAPASIFNEFAGQNVSNAGIAAGEEVTVNDLLHAMLMQSACEAASILAYHYGGGSVAAFVERMNAKAAELGAEYTHFANPHGLDDPDQLSTAYDLYLITKYALSLPRFTDIASTVRYEMAATNKHPETRYVLHTNLMLDKLRGGPKYYYPDMIGLKTGTTDEAGRNLITMVRRSGYTYLLITLGAPIYDAGGKQLADNLSYTDAKKLYDWAFDTFQVKIVVSQDEVVPNEMKVRLSDRKDHLVVLPESAVTELLPKEVDVSSVQKIVNLPSSIDAPVSKGQVLGTMDLKLAGETIRTVNLVAGEDVARSSLLLMLDFALGIVTSWWFILSAVLLAVLITWYVLYTVRRHRRKKQISAYIKRL